MGRRHHGQGRRTSRQKAASMKEINLVLEGGGVKGIALAGAIGKLNDRGYHVKRVAGASVGAIVAALVAAGKAGDIEDLMLSFPFAEMRSTTRLRAAWSLLARGGKYPLTPLRDWVNAQLDGITFRSLKDDGGGSARAERCYKLVVTVTDITRGQLVADAVCASAAFPFFFVPATIEGRVHGGIQQPSGRTTSTLIDGGVLSNFPIEVFQEHDRGKGVESIGIKILPHLPTPPGDRSVVWTPNTHLRPLRLVQQMVGTMVAGRDQARLYLTSVAKRDIPIDTSAA